MMEEAGISIQGLSIGYTAGGRRRTVVAEGLTARAEGGRLTCLIGRNGMGKSTLLRTIAGFQPPLSGSMTIGGEDIAAMTRARRARRLSVVLTSPAGIANMTAADVVGMGRAPYTGFWGSLGKDDLLAVEKAMSLTGTSGLARRAIGRLSDGERQKIMVAKALAQETPAILLDEPTAFLDYPSRLAMMRLLLSLSHDSRRTILLSTHDIEMVRLCADSVWLMESGGMVSGGADDMIRRLTGQDCPADSLKP